jgi:hypothetical protein
MRGAPGRLGEVLLVAAAGAITLTIFFRFAVLSNYPFILAISMMETSRLLY